MQQYHYSAQFNTLLTLIQFIHVNVAKPLN